jgi:hypothetical protein
LTVLAEVFEEVKYHARMTGLIDMDSFYLPEFPLDRLVDAAVPESQTARIFNEDVRTWLANTEYDVLRQSLIQRLERWHSASREIQIYVKDNPKLQDIADLLPVIEHSTGAAIRKLQGESAQGVTQSMLQELEQGQGYVVVAISPGIKQILSE